MIEKFKKKPKSLNLAMNIKLQNQKAAYFSKEFNTKPKSITFAMNKSLKTLISAMNAKNKTNSLAMNTTA